MLSCNNVLSVNSIGSADQAELMKKLNQRKIKWICREMKKGEMGAYSIGRLQHISARHVRRVYAKYREVERPRLMPCGRRPRPITVEEVEQIMAVRREHPQMGAVSIEKVLASREVHIPHNHIHRILKAKGMAKTEPKKSRRRKWIRYERRYSNSLWHTDWFLMGGRQTIAFVDDASRLATAVQMFDKATAENAVTALNIAVQRFGKPKQLMSDHGTQFTSLPRKTCAAPQPNDFQIKLKELCIKHIKARVKHPQSNGKLERFVETIRPLYKHFGDLDKAVEYYDFKRPHMSLENGSIRTPYQAFLDKARKEI